MQANRWMFGPPTTAAEADSCPPEKVLGRKLARLLWRGLNKPRELHYIIVAVHGTKDRDRFTVYTMYYQRGQLEAPWVGDER